MTDPETPNAWDPYLDPGETILWQGKPAPGLVITRNSAGSAAGHIFGIVFSIFWMAMAASAGGVFWMFGLLFLFAAIWGLLKGTIYRRFTWYTLTSKRAFIGQSLPLQNRVLNSYPITKGTTLELQEGRLGSVLFSAAPDGPSSEKTGFERIPDAPSVYTLMRQIQSGDTPP